MCLYIKSYSHVYHVSCYVLPGATLEKMRGSLWSILRLRSSRVEERDSLLREEENEHSINLSTESGAFRIDPIITTLPNSRRKCSQTWNSNSKIPDLVTIRSVFPMSSSFEKFASFRRFFIFIFYFLALYCIFKITWYYFTFQKYLNRTNVNLLSFQTKEWEIPLY